VNIHAVDKGLRSTSNMNDKVLKEILEVLKDIQTKFDTLELDDIVDQFRRNEIGIRNYNEEDHS